MPVIWDEEYLQNHTKKQLNALLDSYDNAEWQCPRCDFVNPCWSRTRTIAGWDNFGTEYLVNKDCVECYFVRKSSKEYNLNGKKPRPKKRKVSPTATTYLVYRQDGKDKWWEPALYKSQSRVVIKWGSNLKSGGGAYKEINFDSPQEALDYYEDKVASKLAKGYFDPYAVKTRKKVASRRAASRKK